MDEENELARKRLGAANMLGDVIAVARERNVSIEELLGKRRFKSLTRARHALWSRIRERYPHRSLPEIGWLFGGYDHTTVMAGIRKHREREGVSGEA